MFLQPQCQDSTYSVFSQSPYTWYIHLFHRTCIFGSNWSVCLPSSAKSLVWRQFPCEIFCCIYLVKEAKYLVLASCKSALLHNDTLPLYLLSFLHSPKRCNPRIHRVLSFMHLNHFQPNTPQWSNCSYLPLSTSHNTQIIAWKCCFGFWFITGLSHVHCHVHSPASHGS